MVHPFATPERSLCLLLLFALPLAARPRIPPPSNLHLLILKPTTTTTTTTPKPPTTEAVETTELMTTSTDVTDTTVLPSPADISPLWTTYREGLIFFMPPDLRIDVTYYEQLMWKVPPPPPPALRSPSRSHSARPWCDIRGPYVNCREHWCCPTEWPCFFYCMVRADLDYMELWHECMDECHCDHRTDFYRIHPNHIPASSTFVEAIGEY